MEAFIKMVLEEYGLAGLVLVIILVLVVKTKNPVAIYQTIKKKFISRGISPRDILMSKIHYCETVSIPSIRIPHPMHDRMLKYLLKRKFNRIGKFADTIFEKIDNDIDQLDLFKVITIELNDAIDAYESDAIEYGIPEEMVVSYFDHNALSVKFLHNAIHLICLSNIYKDNYDRLQAVYNIIHSVLEICISEAYTTSETLGDSIDHLEFRGKRIG